MWTTTNRRWLFARLGMFGVLALSLPAFAQYSSPIRDVDNAARQPVRIQLSSSVGEGNLQGDTSLPAVPAGKRLVIETISFLSTVPVGQLVYLTLTPDPTNFFFKLALPGVRMLSYGNGADQMGATGAYRTYIDPGVQAYVTFYRGFQTPGGVTQVYISISGYYVNLP